MNNTHRSHPSNPIPRRLLGVWSHPDDEAYLAAGLMARTVDAGGTVTLVVLTDGEAGFPDDDPRSTGDRAAHRRHEMRLAMAEIGVFDLRFLGHGDGNLANLPAQTLCAEIESAICDVRPDVITTFGPDGITGHEDHVAAYELTTAAWLHSPIGQLWYAAKTDGWLSDWRELHDSFGVWMTEEPTGVSADEIEFVIDLDGVELDRKRAVLARHASQTEGLAEAFGEAAYMRWIAQETFRLPSHVELFAVDPTSAIANWCHQPWRGLSGDDLMAAV